MKRSHMIIPSIFLGAAVLLGARVAVGSLPLGLETASTSTVAASKPSTDAATDKQIAEREARLTAAQQELRAALDKETPALPAVPAKVKSNAVAVSSRRSGSNSSSSGAPRYSAAASANSGPSANAGQGSSGQPATPSHDADDDHGGDREESESDDDHGDDDHGDDDHGREGDEDDD